MGSTCMCSLAETMWCEQHRLTGSGEWELPDAPGSVPGGVGDHPETVSPATSDIRSDANAIRVPSGLKTGWRAPVVAGGAHTEAPKVVAVIGHPPSEAGSQLELWAQDDTQRDQEPWV